MWWWMDAWCVVIAVASCRLEWVGDCRAFREWKFGRQQWADRYDDRDLSVSCCCYYCCNYRRTTETVSYRLVSLFLLCLIVDERANLVARRFFTHSLDGATWVPTADDVVCAFLFFFGLIFPDSHYARTVDHIFGNFHDNSLTTFPVMLLTLQRAPQSKGLLYSNVVIGMLAVHGWAVTFSTSRWVLCGLRPCPVAASLYQM